MPSPQTPPGNLNRVAASVYLVDHPELNVSADYLGRDGISLSFEGNSTTGIDAMTSIVMSPEPYQRSTLMINLLKSQNLAALWEAQRALSTLIGALQVYPDVQQGGIGVYPLSNCAILNIRELRFAGEDAGYVVSVIGKYDINSTLYNL